MPHDHDDDHGHAVPHSHTGLSPSGHPYRPDQDHPLTYWQCMEIAMRELMIEKGITTELEVMREIDRMDSRSPADGARVVARAWTEPDFRARLMEAPAAKRIHHAYRGGLLEHLYEVLRLAEPLMELYPELDRDLLVTGILLHDIGKLEELTPDLETDYTDRGRLLGHVVIGSERVGEIIRRLEGFPEELALRLQHMILAHHGRYKWGSPRRPKTLEAVALHHLENLDTQVNRFRELLEAARARGLAWTDYDRLLGRSLYAGDGTDLSAEERGQAE